MIYPIVAGVCVALISILGIVLFKDTAHKNGMHRFVLPVAVGIFLGIVFLELVPETLASSPEYGAYAILFGFLSFYLLSHFLSTYHHHHKDGDGCTEGKVPLILIGDGIHNIADGIVIATAFMIDPVIGIATTIGVILHELPQEIAEFGILVQGGYSRKKALLLNLLSASSVFIGIAIALFVSTVAGPLLFVITGIAAGNLLYIATSDFIPELRKSHKDHFKSTFIATLFGLACIATLLTISHEFIGHHHDEHGEEEIHADEHDEHLH